MANYSAAVGATCSGKELPVGRIGIVDDARTDGSRGLGNHPDRDFKSAVLDVSVDDPSSTFSHGVVPVLRTRTAASDSHARKA